MAGGRNRRASYLRCLTRGYKSGNRRQRGRGVVLSRRTPLIAHRRVGWCGSTLWMLKLRTMWGQDSLRAATGSHWIEYIHDDEGPENKQDSDPRVTHWFAASAAAFLGRNPATLARDRGRNVAGWSPPLTATELARHYGAAAQEILQVKPGLVACGRCRAHRELPERAAWT